MTKRETIAYIAGIVDGEGHIAMRVDHGKYRSPILTVTNTNKPLLDFLQSKYGGSMCALKVRSPKHNQAWSWRVSSKAAYTMIKDIRPHLIVKRAKALEVIAYYKNKKNKGLPPSKNLIAKYL